MIKTVDLLAYACDLGASEAGCAHGPDVVFSERQAWAVGDDVVVPPPQFFRPPIMHTDITDEIAAVNTQLAGAVSRSLTEHGFPVIVGGDHSCALGTWAGVHEVVGDFGLLWIDAHMDAHTPETSHSGNVHGMPVAALLGYGYAQYTGLLNPGIKLRPENVCLFGVRDYEPEEKRLLESLGVHVMDMAEVMALGMTTALQTALSIIGVHQPRPFGISIDMDAFDPGEVIAVGTPVADGLPVDGFIDSLEVVKPWAEKLACLEIAEFNPQLDAEGKSALWVHQLIKALLQVKLKAHH